jgi:hypothetical protein
LRGGLSRKGIQVEERDDYSLDETNRKKSNNLTLDIVVKLLLKVVMVFSDVAYIYRFRYILDIIEDIFFQQQILVHFFLYFLILQVQYIASDNRVFQK